jgi:hypothetical protein
MGLGRRRDSCCGLQEGFLVLGLGEREIYIGKPKLRSFGFNRVI